MALALTMVFLVFRDTAGAQPLFYLAFVYGVLWVGTTPLLRRFVPRHDYSYGIYLYGFMVQQCVANIAPQLSHVTAVLDRRAVYRAVRRAVAGTASRGRC